jgi:hypothetical protein
VPELNLHLQVMTTKTSTLKTLENLNIYVLRICIKLNETKLKARYKKYSELNKKLEIKIHELIENCIKCVLNSVLNFSYYCNNGIKSDTICLT